MQNVNNLSNVDSSIGYFIKKTSLKDRIKSEMIEHAKRYISQSDMTPQIISILKQNGINSSTSASTSFIRLLKRPATEQSSPTTNKPLIEPKKPRNQLVDNIFPYNPQLVSQPEQTIEDEPMPVLEPEEQKVDEEEYINVVDGDDQIFPVPQKQKDVPFSVDDCAAHLKQLLIASDQEMKKYDEYQRELERRHEAAKRSKLGDLDYHYRKMFTTEQIRYRMTRNTQNQINSFKSHLRVTNIKHKLEMIEYIEKNLTPEQLTDEILDLVENKSTAPKSLTNQVTGAFGEQLKDLEILVETEDELNRKGSEIMDAIDELTNLIKQELTVNRNMAKAREYDEIISEREISLNTIMNEIEAKRRVYATKYIAPEIQDNFVSNGNLPALLVDMVADARNKGRLANVKILGDRLKKLTDDLSKEFDQVISSIQSTSTSVNFSGRFDTFVPPKNTEIVVQFVGAKNADDVVNGEQPDNHV